MDICKKLRESFEQVKWQEVNDCIDYMLKKNQRRINIKLTSKIDEE